MPELPEVEVTMRGVSPALKGSVIKSVFKGEKKLRIPLSDDLYQLKDAYHRAFGDERSFKSS